MSLLAFHKGRGISIASLTLAVAACPSAFGQFDPVVAGCQGYSQCSLMPVTTCFQPTTFPFARIGGSISIPGRPGSLQVTENELANQLAGSGIKLVSAAYTGATGASGLVAGLDGHIGGIDAVVVLSTGDLENLLDTCSHSIVLPDPKLLCRPNPNSLITTANGLPGDKQLDALLDGFTTQDASTLEIEFIPTYKYVQLSYVFASDEYPEYANTGFSDIFAILLNGSNVALLPNRDVSVSVDTVNGGNPCTGQIARSQSLPFFVDNQQGQLPFEADGLTLAQDAAGNRVPMLMQAEVNPGVPNTLRLSIGDVGDSWGDSFIILKIKSLVSVPVLEDSDSDGVADGIDNCPFVPNPDQVDSNFNGIGDACDTTPTLPSEPVTWDKFTGGGSVLNIVGSKDWSTFGFTIMPKKRSLSINLEYNDHENGIRIKINNDTASYTNREDLYGVGLQFTVPCEVRRGNGKTQSGYSCSGYIVDVAEPGTGSSKKGTQSDQFKIAATSTDPGKPGYASGPADIVSGNVQAHKP